MKDTFCKTKDQEVLTMFVSVRRNTNPNPVRSNTNPNPVRRNQEPIRSLSWLLYFSGAG